MKTKDLETLVVGPTDVLLLKLPVGTSNEDMKEVHARASKVLGKRCLVVHGDVQMGVVRGAE